MEGRMMRCGACGSEVGSGSDPCPVCGHAVKAEAVAKDAGTASVTTSRRWLTRGLLAVVLCAGLWVFYHQAFRAYHPVIAGQPDVPVPALPPGKVTSTMIEAAMMGGSIVIPVQKVVEHRIVRFRDPGGVQTVLLLAYVTPTGRLVTAMSLSENCRSDDFYLEGEDIHCVHCPSYWNASSLEAYACCQKYYPDPIPSTVVGDEVRIDADVVRRWKPRS